MIGGVGELERRVGRSNHLAALYDEVELAEIWYRRAMHAALNIDGPTYAHEILTMQELLAAFEATAVAA
jgi:hypothetical protein